MKVGEKRQLSQGALKRGGRYSLEESRLLTDVWVLGPAGAASFPQRLDFRGPGSPPGLRGHRAAPDVWQ